MNFKCLKFQTYFTKQNKKLFFSYYMQTIAFQYKRSAHPTVNPQGILYTVAAQCPAAPSIDKTVSR